MHDRKATPHRLGMDGVDVGDDKDAKAEGYR